MEGQLEVDETDELILIMVPAMGGIGALCAPGLFRSDLLFTTVSYRSREETGSHIQIQHSQIYNRDYEAYVHVHDIKVNHSQQCALPDT